jgi:hypothetical protein
MKKQKTEGLTITNPSDHSEEKPHRFKFGTMEVKLARELIRGAIAHRYKYPVIHDILKGLGDAKKNEAFFFHPNGSGPLDKVDEKTMIIAVKNALAEEYPKWALRKAYDKDRKVLFICIRRMNLTRKYKVRAK